MRRMSMSRRTYIYQQENWPNFIWDINKISDLLADGRITRAITDLLLARSDGLPQRFYSMSSRIQKERKSYYDILEKIQKGELDITE